MIEICIRQFIIAAAQLVLKYSSTTGAVHITG